MLSLGATSVGDEDADCANEIGGSAEGEAAATAVEAAAALVTAAAAAAAAAADASATVANTCTGSAVAPTESLSPSIRGLKEKYFSGTCPLLPREFSTPTQDMTALVRTASTSPWAKDNCPAATASKDCRATASSG